jgi:hypothetical protein
MHSYFAISSESSIRSRSGSVSWTFMLTVLLLMVAVMLETRLWSGKAERASVTP